MSEIETHADLLKHYPALADSATVVGGPPVRNRATLGGNICNASPAADTSTPLLALAAQVVVAGTNGESTIPLAELWGGPRTTTLAAGEAVKEVRLPNPAPRSGSAFERLTRTAMDIALVNAAAVVTVDEAGNFAGLRCALGAVGPTVLEVTGLEAEIGGKPCNEEALERVRELARKAAKPIDDKRASADYRRDMAGVLAARAVQRAHNLAVGGKDGAK
jgi:carbon-monoxide dehydrogenase medium subunit